jgi:hypothetical protein
MSGAMSSVLRAALLVLIAAAAPARADEVDGELSVDGPRYAGRPFRAFEFEFDQAGRASFEIRSDIWAALAVVDPGGAVSAVSMFDMEEGVPARIVLDTPVPGRWVAVAAGVFADNDGSFTLEYDGIGPLAEVGPGGVDPPLIERAFAALGAFTPDAWRRHAAGALAERLSLASYRAELKAKLGSAIAEAESAVAVGRDELKRAEARESEVLAALAEAERTPALHPLVAELLQGERAAVEADLETAAASVAEALGGTALLVRALEDLREVEAAAGRLAEAEARIHADGAGGEASAFSEATREFRSQSGGVAERMVDSGLAELLELELTWNLAGRDVDIYEGEELGGAAFEPTTGEVAASAEPEPMGGSAELEASAYFSQLLPWPPPEASARALIDRRAFVTAERPEPTLGDVSDLLTDALVEAGYLGSGFLGVPDGFALATRIEQYDSSGVPLDGQARWSTQIGTLSSYSISDIIRALVTAPKGYFRVIVFVVSSQSFADSGARATLATVEEWMHAENTLPEAVRQMPFTGAHQVTALVYEFEKRTNAREDAILHVPGLLDVARHFAHTRLAADLR